MKFSYPIIFKSSGIEEISFNRDNFFWCDLEYLSKDLLSLSISSSERLVICIFFLLFLIFSAKLAKLFVISLLGSELFLR